ncbi:MAG: FmdB family transcriptional regulator [Acidobacteria bacterium]|nr:FmdB family transcriptional regulator [Acidobacteriota bacterium]
MPTYSYRCTECGEAFDIQQAFTDDTLSVCPNCGGKLRKLFNSVGVTFTGSGFYRNDSRPAPAGESAPAAAPKTADSSSASAASPSSGSSSSPASPASKE